MHKKTTSCEQDGYFASLPFLGLDDQHFHALIGTGKLSVLLLPFQQLGSMPSFLICQLARTFTVLAISVLTISVLTISVLSGLST
ncbi:hypothetical protein BV504_20285 [Halomonas sp. 'Soap Lake |nr:hypothetical protein B2G49_20445 [Halomonas sp. 'Soap Lake \